MLRFVYTNLPATGKRNGSNFPPTLFFHIRHIHALRFEFFQSLRDVITHEIEFVLAVARRIIVAGIMKGGFKWRHGENQPAVAGINRRKLQYIAKERAIRFRVLAVDNDMRGVDQAGLRRGKPSAISLDTLSDHSADAHARSALPDTQLVSDEVRKEICQNAEKSQPGNSVSRENPCATAFAMLADRLLGR